ncbi:exodeoxyribonuclease VII large subunit, partial [Salinarimonas sp. NSM]|uniref:exodeoxyribonuclease VII large subunit n=1 Tax=Salinarimonas sp. NSM TaxID=3458003 RepID=UPI004036D5F3
RTLAGVWQLAESLSWRSVLARGYALVRDDDGRPVRAAASVAPGAALTLEFADGRLGARAEGGGTRSPEDPPQAEAPTEASTAAPARKNKPARATKAAAPSAARAQGSLFDL